MHKYRPATLAFTIFMAIASFLTATPTANFLEEHPLSEISSFNPSNYTLFTKQTPFFLSIATNEQDPGFIGYHGCTQKFRLFQDILRATFEESFAMKIPKDFQFLRIPGDQLYDLKNNKSDYYKLFDRKKISNSNKQYVIEQLFISKFNLQFDTFYSFYDFTPAEHEQLWGVVLEFVDTLDLLARDDYYTFDDTQHASGAPFENKGLKKKSLSQDLYMDSVKLKIDSLVKHFETEEIPALNKKFFQSSHVANILTKVFTPKLSANHLWQLKNWSSSQATFTTFLFYIQVQTYYSNNHELTRFFFPYDDTLKEQQTRVIAMNIPLFGNFHRPGNCTTDIFIKGASIAKGDSAVDKVLEDFFVQIGYQKEIPQELFQIGLEELKNHNQGCILQFFDASQTDGASPYAGLDSSSFVCHSFGIPLKIFQPSELLLESQPIRYNGMDLQLRLIASTHTTLNPYWFLKIKRHDTLPKEVSNRILKRMKEHLANSSGDKKKLKKKKLYFKKLWNF